MRAKGGFASPERAAARGAPSERSERTLPDSKAAADVQIQKRAERLVVCGARCGIRPGADVLEAELGVEREARVDHDLVAKKRTHRDALSADGDTVVVEVDVQQLAAQLHAVPEVADHVDAHLAARLEHGG